MNFLLYIADRLKLKLKKGVNGGKCGVSKKKIKWVYNIHNHYFAHNIYENEERVSAKDVHMYRKFLYRIDPCLYFAVYGSTYGIGVSDYKMIGVNVRVCEKMRQAWIMCGKIAYYWDCVSDINIVEHNQVSKRQIL